MGWNGLRTVTFGGAMCSATLKFGLSLSRDFFLHRVGFGFGVGIVPVLCLNNECGFILHECIRRRRRRRNARGSDEDFATRPKPGNRRRNREAGWETAP